MTYLLYFHLMRNLKSSTLLPKLMSGELDVSKPDNGIPFSVEHKSIPSSLAQAISDSRNHQNLHGPFESGEAAVAAMLED